MPVKDGYGFLPHIYIQWSGNHRNKIRSNHNQSFFFILHKNRMQVSEGVECQKEWVVLSSRTIYQQVSLLFKIIKDSQQPNLVSASLGLQLSRVGYNSILVKFNFSKLQTMGSHNGSHYINSCQLKNNDSLYKPK